MRTQKWASDLHSCVFDANFERLDIVGNKAKKGRISKRVFQENKPRQIFRKTNISYPLIRKSALFSWNTRFDDNNEIRTHNHITIECGFTLKLVRDMIITYSQMHRTDKYSQHSSVTWPVWLNHWVFVYEISGCGFESHCCHLNYSSFTVRQTKECGFTLKLVRDMRITYNPFWDSPFCLITDNMK